MTKLSGWATIVTLALLGLVVLAGQEPAKVQSGVYLCSAVESPSLLQVEGVGTVRLIGVQVAEGTPEASKALDLVKKLVEGKLVRIDVCPVRPKDKQGNVRAEVFYAEKGQWFSLNRRLIREGLAKLVAEPDCHIDFTTWQPSKPKAVPPKVTKPAPVQRERKVAAVPPSLKAVPRVKREAPRPTPVLTRRSVEDIAWRAISIPIAFRDAMYAADLRVFIAAGNLNAWREVRWRIDTLQRALLPIVAKVRLTPRVARVLFGFPVTEPGVGGEPFPQRIIRLGLTDRKETLAEVLNWFPDIRQQLLQRLRIMGAIMVGGPLPTTVGAGPTAGGPGAPMGGGPMMGGPGMAGPSMIGPEAAVGMPGGPGGPMGGPPTGMMPGAGMGMAGAGVGGAASVGAVVPGVFYAFLEQTTRFKTLERALGAREYEESPYIAAVQYLALEAYKEYVDEQIRLATAEYQRAREEWAELMEIVTRELKKLVTTPLRR